MPIDPETGEPYKVEVPPTKADYIFGALWCVVGVFGLVYAHLAGQVRKLRGH